MFKLMPIITKLDMPSPEDALSSIASWLLTIAQGAGVIIIIWGAVQFFLSLRDQNPDGQQRAIWTLVAGVALAALGTVLHDFGIDIATS